MGLKPTLKRWRHVYGWRVRYWLLDTRSGLQVRITLLLLGVIVVAVEVVLAILAAFHPAQASSPLHAYESINWFIGLAFGFLTAYLWDLTKPKPAKDSPDNSQSPTTDDGQSVKHHFGTCWVDDSFLLAWKVVGRTPIKAKGGGK